MPNYNAQIETYLATNRDVIDNILGEYGGKNLNTFNLKNGKEVLRGYIAIEAQLRNMDE